MRTFGFCVFVNDDGSISKGNRSFPPATLQAIGYLPNQSRFTVTFNFFLLNFSFLTLSSYVHAEHQTSPEKVAYVCLRSGTGCSQFITMLTHRARPLFVFTS